ncbi:MAG: hypothetical protein EZS28_018583 [Streblomastix strix]|uniref:Uncharacterized protein n=1 Tax=Streblomastix strix TaxID=222440 RepID=A0A5J4VTD2_9EUKA|nr:MAG: hypothetical protein EZS28_018583 [Streblomastix strix]
MGFIRKQLTIRPPRQNITFENITARVGNGTIGKQHRAQQRALIDQIGSGLIKIVGRLAKDIKKVKALVNEQSTQHWIEEGVRIDNNYGSWYDKTIWPIIPVTVGKQLFSNAVQIVLKGMSRAIDENFGRTNQALRRKQQLTFLKLAPFLWKSHFIGVYAAANAPQQAKLAFTQANYFNMYNDLQTRKQFEAINKQAINVFNNKFQ